MKKERAKLLVSNLALSFYMLHGWGVLAWVPKFKKFEILQCEKHQNLTLWSCKPIFVIDMWEHSYFLQYKANRAEYINAFWNIVNWNVVNKRFEEINLDQR